MITQRRHHRGRVLLVIVLAACWALGWVGLDGGRASAFQLFVFVCVTAMVTTAVAAMRRHTTEARSGHVRPHARVEQSNCRVIHSLGERT